MTTAYSYVRWSSAGQTDGSSRARQTENAVAYAAQHKLTLSTQSYIDAGISGFKGRNADEGALRTFINACEQGIVAPGSFLLVDNFDRLSRLPPLKALRLLQEITEHGVTLVTVKDGKRYSEKSIDDNWSDLITALVEMARAHEESKNKGRMVKIGWDKARANNKVFSKLCPSWLTVKPDRSGFDLVPENVLTVQRIFQLAFEGKGSHLIARALQSENRPTFRSAPYWELAQILSILRNEAVVGHYQQRTQKGKIGTFRRENYFPPIVERFVFDEVQRLLAKRSKGGPKGDSVGNLFSGMLRCQCGAVTRFVSSNPTFKYVRCKAAYNGDVVCSAAAHPYRELEQALLEVLLIIEKVEIEPQQTVEPDKALELRARIASNSKALERLMAVLEQGKEFAGTPAAMLKRMGELEDALSADRKELNKTPPPKKLKNALEAAFEVFEKHEKATGAERYELRLRIQAVFRQLLTRIVLVKGHSTHEFWSAPTVSGDEVMKEAIDGVEESDPEDPADPLIQPVKWELRSSMMKKAVIMYGPLADILRNKRSVIKLADYEATNDGGVVIWYRLASDAIARSKIKRR